MLCSEERTLATSRLSLAKDSDLWDSGCGSVSVGRGAWTPDNSRGRFQHPAGVLSRLLRAGWSSETAFRVDLLLAHLPALCILSSFLKKIS